MPERIPDILDVYAMLEEAEAQIQEGKVMDADESLARIRAELNV